MHSMLSVKCLNTSSGLLSLLVVAIQLQNIFTCNFTIHTLNINITETRWQPKGSTWSKVDHIIWSMVQKSYVISIA